MKPTNLNSKHKVYAFLLFLLVSTQCFSQSKLVLWRHHNKNKIIFEKGDEIKVKVKGWDYYVGGTILGFHDRVIHFSDFDISIDNISEVNIEGRRFGGFNIGQYGPTIALAGPLYLGIDVLNRGRIDRATVIQAASVTALGVFLYLIRRKKFKIKGKNRILIV